MMLNNISLGVGLLAKQLGVELADLSTCDNPEGRIDFLLSKFVESGMRGLPPELQMTYHAMRPLLDGYLKHKVGGVKVKIPEEVRQLFAQMGRKDAA